MSRHLPDVNVLFALLWPPHESHAAARAWFAKSGHRAWATSPLTQLGVLRLLTNPAVTRGAVNAAIAVQIVDRATRHNGHEFWPLDRKMMDGLRAFAERLQGHKQWTDAALLCQSIDRDGLLVTFDAGLKDLAAREPGSRVLFLRRA